MDAEEIVWRRIEELMLFDRVKNVRRDQKSSRDTEDSVEGKSMEILTLF
jgi:hypothetical protein